VQLKVIGSEVVDWIHLILIISHWRDVVETKKNSWVFMNSGEFY